MTTLHVKHRLATKHSGIPILPYPLFSRNAFGRSESPSASTLDQSWQAVKVPSVRPKTPHGLPVPSTRTDWSSVAMTADSATILGLWATLAHFAAIGYNDWQGSACCAVGSGPAIDKGMDTLNPREPHKPDPAAQPPPAAALCFRLLGELTVTVHHEPLAPPPHRTHGLLAVLLLYPRAHRRERLVGLLYPETPERKGRQRLSHSLWLLRKSLPDLPLEASQSEVCLPAEVRWLDVEAFRRAAGQDAGRVPLELWEEALALYRGDLLEGVYDDWLLEEREALYLQYVRLAHRACDELLRQGRTQAVLAIAERLVQREPYDEWALRRLMQAYLDTGRRGAALAAYERFVALAAAELGVEPEPATRTLAESIRTMAAAPRARTAPAPTGDSPSFLLSQARQALGRGERMEVEDCLERLRTGCESCEDDVLLLEIDLALLFEEYDRAGQLLEGCSLERAAEHVRTARLAAGRHEGAIASDEAVQALMRAHEEGDKATELEALLVLVEAQQQLGENAQAMRSAEQALILARECGSFESIARAGILRGFGQIYQGRYARALSHLQEARAVALEHGLRPALASALRGIRMVLTQCDAFKEALAASQEELSIWRDLGLERWEAAALEGRALIQDMLGHSQESLLTLEQASEISRRLGDPVRIAINCYNLASSLLYLDDALAPRALKEAQAALECFRAHEQPGWEAATLTIMGYALWVDGQHAAALDHFREAYAISERIGELLYLPELLAYQGLASLGLDECASALDLTGAAVLAQAQGEVSEEIVPEIYYAHAMALSACGQEDRARKYLVRAYDRLLSGAAQFEEEEARQAYFHRNPTLRRLMREVAARGIAPAPELRIVSQPLPAARGGGPVRVAWTVDAGPADIALKQAQGAIGLRRARLARMVGEAEAQGAAPTVADLANALGVSKRTVQRDLAALRHDRGG